MTATGIVEPMPEWEETAEGIRRPTDRQARDENTGMPLWAVEGLYPQTAFGRTSTVTAKVTVGSVDKPQVGELKPIWIRFAGLSVQVRMLTSGGFGESWLTTGAEVMDTLFTRDQEQSDR